MNYIKLLNWYRDYLLLNHQSTAEIALYHALLMINNKCGWKEWFTAPNSTIQLLTGISETHLIAVRNKLKQNNLIDYNKALNPRRAGSYKVVIPNITEPYAEPYAEPTVNQTHNVLKQKQKLNKDNNKKGKPEIVKSAYGEFQNVFLSDVELDRLQQKLPNDYLRLIEKLSGGIDSKGYKYTNFYSTILNWHKNEQERMGQQPRGKPEKQSFFDKLREINEESEVIDIE